MVGLLKLQIVQASGLGSRVSETTSIPVQHLILMSGSRPHTQRSEAASTHSGRHIEPAQSSGRNPPRCCPERSPIGEARSSTSANSALAGAVPNIADRVRQRIFGRDTTSVADRVQQWRLNPHAKSLPGPLQKQPLSPHAPNLLGRIPQRPLDAKARPWRPGRDTLPTSAQDDQKTLATSGIDPPTELSSSTKRELQRSFSGSAILGIGSTIELLSSPKRELQRTASGSTPSPSHGPITRTLPGLLDTVQVRSLGPVPTRQRDQPRLASIDMGSDLGNEITAGFGSVKAPAGFSERVSSKSSSFTRVPASVPGPALSRGVSQQSMDPLTSAKSDSSLGGASADSSEKILQPSVGPLPLGKTRSRPLRAPAGSPEKDPRWIFPPSMSTTECLATARTRPSVPDLTQQPSLESLSKGAGIQPCLVPITIDHDPSNIAAVRRLVNQYTHRIKAAKEAQFRNQMEIQKLTEAMDSTDKLSHIRLRGMELLPALLEKPSQVEERMLLAKQAVVQRQGEDKRFEQRISSLGDRRGRLQDVLSLVPCPSEFRSRMKLALEYLLSIPDIFDPNVLDVNWDTCDHFEERPLD